MRLAAGTAKDSTLLAARSIAPMVVRVVMCLCPNLTGHDDGGFDLITR
jgi:hypothetical protein